MLYLCDNAGSRRTFEVLNLVGLSFLMWAAQQGPSTAAAQTDARPQFEVASVKISPEGTPFRYTGGPQTSSPERFSCSACTMDLLRRKEWNINRFQLASDPALYKDLFDISAIVPAAASPDEYRLMLQDLLKTRLKLVVHFEKMMMTT
jgi:uncharacterized protein (TIGR03435 family)